MKKINKYLFILCAFLWVFLSPKVYADDPTSRMLQDQKDLEDMITSSVEVASFVHQEWDKRNPFDDDSIKTVVQKAPTVTVEDKPVLVLQGLFLGSERPSVIINRMVVGIGDQVEGCTVREINEDRVLLDDPKGNKIILSLKQ